VTLGLVVDEQGFAKSSNLYSGNISEPQTLESMIADMAKKTSNDKNVQTVIMDAGMSTEENMRWLKEHKYSYITIHRGNAPFKYDFEKKEIKEKSMRSRIENLLVERLTYYKAGLEKRGRAKTYSKIMEMIGRLKEKYSKVAKLYTIEVVPEETDGHEMKTVNVKDITWEKNDKYAVEEEREGSYILKTDRTDLSDKEIWDLYIMLRRIEHSFLCMKSHLGLRPNFHSLERRADAHMFISVVAYHIMHAIEHRLHQKKDSRTWETIKNLLKTHNRITISFNKKMPDGKERKQMIRLSTRLEESHAEIYLKLGLDGVPLPRKLLLNSG
jgi:transposase